MRIRITPSRALFAAIAALGLSSIVNAQSVATTPVGAVTQSVAAGSGSGTFTFMGFPLLRPSVWTGQLTGVSGAALSVPAGSLTAGAFSASKHYVTVTSGANVGLMVDIASNDTGSITLAEDVSGLIGSTDKVVVRAHSTLASLFGSTNSAGFTAATAIAGADEIRIFNPTTQNFINYYYKSGGIGGAGWRTSASNSIDRSGDVIYPEQSIVILRKSASALALTVVGEVNSSQVKIPAETGFSWIINTAPKATTLGALGFYTGSGSTGLTGATALSGADELWRWTGSSWEVFYYKTGGIGGAGWRTAASNSIDRAGQVIGAGEPVLVRRKGAPLLLTQAGFTIPL